MRSITLVVSFGLAFPALGQSFVESFEGGSNIGGWTFAASTQGPTMPGGAVQPWFFQATDVVTDVPSLRTGAGVTSPFVGNYITKQIGSLAIALKVFAVAPTLTTFRPALVLTSYNGTPGDPSDDWAAFALSSNQTTVGTWGFHSFSVPSYVLVRPAYWTFFSLGPNAPAAPTWPGLMASVDAVAFSLLDPSTSHPARTWTLGGDFIRIIAVGDACYANCDANTIVPFLNVNDFVCFNNRFAAGDTRANCDSSTTPPVLNVNDFICFNEKFAAGCSAP